MTDLRTSLVLTRWILGGEGGKLWGGLGCENQVRRFYAVGLGLFLKRLRTKEKNVVGEFFEGLLPRAGSGQQWGRKNWGGVKTGDVLGGKKEEKRHQPRGKLSEVRSIIARGCQKQGKGRDQAGTGSQPKRTRNWFQHSAKNATVYTVKEEGGGAKKNWGNE